MSTLEPNRLYLGDCLAHLPEMADASIDAVVTDPPYGLSDHKTAEVVECLTAWCRGEIYTPKGKGFMGKGWDAWVPGPEVWREVIRVLKPGGHLLAFAGTRSMDLMSMAIRLAGFELRDSIGWAHEDGGGAPLIAWTHGQGFPKSLDVSKAIDKVAGAEREVVGPPPYTRGKAGQAYSETRKVGYDYPPQPITAPSTDAAKQWSGWGTALKPAWEPIILARKPLVGTVAANVVEHGTGALNIDACRVPVDATADASQLRVMNRGQRTEDTSGQKWGMSKGGGDAPQVVRADGRFPANLIHDGSPEVLAAFPDAPGQLANSVEDGEPQGNSVYSPMKRGGPHHIPRDEATKSAARFFYCAKANKADRNEGVDAKGNKHPTVKPTALMAYLCRLITPPGGIVLDPFMGSGSTGKAAIGEGFRFVGVERDEDSFKTAEARIKAAMEAKP